MNGDVRVAVHAVEILNSLIIHGVQLQCSTQQTLPIVSVQKIPWQWQEKLFWMSTQYDGKFCCRTMVDKFELVFFICAIQMFHYAARKIFILHRQMIFLNFIASASIKILVWP